jgi:hypothetical protein
MIATSFCILLNFFSLTLPLLLVFETGTRISGWPQICNPSASSLQSARVHTWLHFHFLFCFDGTGACIQDLTPARQALYHLSRAIPFCIGYF